ncbi:MAG: hypothetical protein ONB46_02010 [candidate division KSB1 bacterium]|nr:hypothetical protein [candidate division KSB1 bacterium]MDZ7364443.1 hypothetical protein [candidate division KSB1 bacterium]
MLSCRYQRLFVGLLLLLSGCSENQSTKEVLLEFKQQPDEKFVYHVADSVEWEIEDAEKNRYTFQHLQNQRCEMVIESLDSAMVRALTMSFVVTKDTMLNAPEFVIKKRRRRLMAGWQFGFKLRMRQNGEIVKVLTDDPKSAFDFDRMYKPSQPVFPERAISPGYSWSQNFPIEVPRGNPTVATTKYQLNSFARLDRFDCAVIDFKGGLEYEECYKPPENKPAGFLLKKYLSQVTSEGRIFFAYREGFMVKRVNLITSTVRTTTYTKDKTERQSQTIFKDHETITLTAIHRLGQESMTYRVP